MTGTGGREEVNRWEAPTSHPAEHTETETHTHLGRQADSHTPEGGTRLAQLAGTTGLPPEALLPFHARRELLLPRTLIISMACARPSLVVQMVKNLPARQETQVLTLGREDPLEKGMATH